MSSTNRPRKNRPIIGTSDNDVDDVLAGTADGVRRAVNAWLKVNHRHEVHIDAPLPDKPALIVGNHGFGGVTDLNAWAVLHALETAEVKRPVTTLVHRITAKFGPAVGRLATAVGAVPGASGAAQQAFAEGRHVLVFPGGDRDAAKSWRRRNTVGFYGRSGFAKVAIDAGVPVVPVVCAGTGETLFVLSDGQWIVRKLRLKKLLGMSTAAVSWSFPLGLTVNLTGVLPYLPLPAKLETAVMPPMWPAPKETPAEFALRIEKAMQARMDDLVDHRIPFVG